MPNAALRATLCALLTLSGIGAHADPLRPSVAQQIKLGQQAAAQLRHQSKVLPASDIRVKTLRRIARRILSTFPAKEPWQYSFDVIDAPDVNAFALPGGPTFFYTGLLDKLKTEDEIAGILGHELTHVRKQHWARMEGDTEARNLFVTGALLIFHVGATGQQLAGAIATLADLRYSRKDESAADQGGFEASAAAGYNPIGLADAFEMLDKLGGHEPEFLSDHPSDANRIKHIKEDVAAAKKTFPPQRPVPWAK